MPVYTQHCEGILKKDATGMEFSSYIAQKLDRESLFCFQSFIVWVSEFYYPFTTQSRCLMTLGKRAFENIVGKGENAGNQHFLIFPQFFLPFPKQISSFESYLICHL